MIIEAEGLSKTLGRNQVLKDLTFSVPKGAAMAMVGANGAGKTTAIRTILNLYPADGGVSRVMGVESGRLRHRDFQDIGFVSENQKLPPRLTVAQLFDYLRPLYDRWDRDLENKLRADYGLPANRRIGALSHGMRMKAALIAALPFRPKLLVLDEPLSGLDPLVRDEVVEGVLSQAEDMTILISSHELTEIEGFATDVMFIEDGTLKFQETMDDLRLRFRQVTATFAQPVTPPAKPSPRWISVAASGHTLSFIDGGFVDEATLARGLTDCAGPVQHIETMPLSFRDISKALMKAARKEVRQ